MKTESKNFSGEQAARFDRSVSGYTENGPIELILAVSMSNKKQRGEYLKLFVDLINRHNKEGSAGKNRIDKIIVLLSCALQRHYVDEAYAKQEGDKWKEENECYLKALSVPYEIVRWSQWIKGENFKKAYAKICEIYYKGQEDNLNHKAFKSIVENVSKSHVGKGDEKARVSYLLEECAVFLTMEDCYVAYPSNQLNSAVCFVLENFGVKNFTYMGYAFYSKKEKLKKEVGPAAFNKEKVIKENPEFKEAVKSTIIDLQEMGILNPKKQTKVIDEVVSQVIKELDGNGNISFDLMGINYSVIDCEGNYLVQNNCAALEISKNLSNANEIDAATWADCKAVIEKKTRSIKEEEFKRRYYFSIKQPLFDENKQCLGILIISVDITDKKQAEIAKIQFLENMRHDIRTPLTGIVGVAELLRLKIKDKDPEIAELIQTMHESAHMLSEFLNEILEAIKVISESKSVFKKRFDLRSILESAFKLNLAAAVHKNLTFNFEYDEQLSLPFIGDPDRIKRIVLELLTNAIKFTHEGEVKLAAEKIGEKGDVFVVALIVSDTGIGIPKNKQSEIYTRFNRLTPSHQGIYKGTGLGLFIIKEYIDVLHGELSVESDPITKPGSVFKCLLPLEPALPGLKII